MSHYSSYSQVFTSYPEVSRLAAYLWEESKRYRMNSGLDTRNSRSPGRCRNLYRSRSITSSPCGLPALDVSGISPVRGNTRLGTSRMTGRQRGIPVEYYESPVQTLCEHSRY